MCIFVLSGMLIREWSENETKLNHAELKDESVSRNEEKHKWVSDELSFLG